MLILDKIITENMEEIITPISKEITNRFLKYLGIHKIFKDRMIFNSLVENIIRDHNEKNEPLFPYNYVIINIKPNYNPKESKWDTFTNRNMAALGTRLDNIFTTYPIFADRKHRIALHQLTVPQSIDLEFSTNVRSIELSEIINSALFNKCMNDSVFEYNDVIFSYPIPDVMIYMLHRFYKMLELDPTHLSFKDYLTTGSNSQIGALFNRDIIENKQIVVNQSLRKVLLKTSYDAGAPDPNMVNKVAVNYTQTFTLSFQFSKPNMLRLSYPYTINNHAIPKKFIPKRNVLEEKKMNAVYPERAINDTFLKYNKRFNVYQQYPFIQYPANIDNNPIHIIKIKGYDKNYFPIFAGVLESDIDPNTNKASINIDIVNELYPLFPESLKNELDDSFTYQSVEDFLSFIGIFSIMIIANDSHIVNPENINLDLINKTINITQNIDKTIEYKIIINIIENMNYLNKALVYKMLESAKQDFFEPIIFNNMQRLELDGYVEIINRKGVFSNDSNNPGIQPNTPEIILKDNPEITSNVNQSVYHGRMIHRINKYIFMVKN